MKLTGNLKKQVENENTMDGRKKLIEKAGMLLTDDELGRVAGGAGGNKSYIFDLSRFTSRTVCNVVMYNDTACLTLRKTPGGPIIRGTGWKNGEPIMVHSQYTEDGWYFAYDNRTDKYGYVNPNCVL